MTTLIVEDNEMAGKLLAIQLESEGFDTIVACDGQKALDILDSTKIDCVVSDLMMPNIDGYRLVYKIRRDIRLKGLPFIMYSAGAISADDEEFIFRLGVNKFVRKTGNAKSIADAVSHLLVNPGDARPRKGTEAAHDQWVIEKYNNLLVDKLEDKIMELESANKELEAFSYSISHDLRAPLRAISGYVCILHDEYEEVLDDEGKRLLNKIGDNAIRMGILIDSLLAFARLGKANVRKTRVNTKVVVEEILADIGVKTNGPSIFEIGELRSAYADKTLIKQVFFNLMTNAVKFSAGKTSPMICIASEDVGNEIIYHVKDNGCGFNKIYIDKLFKVFQRLHAADEFEGVGVGLALVKRIVLKHGGNVWAEGIVGEGANFYFSLPKEA